MALTFSFNDYNLYHQSDFKHRWLKPEVLYQKLDSYRNASDIEIGELGKSMERKPIYEIKYGNGPIRIMLWSQMHGNEPTATMAIVNLLAFFTAHDTYDDYRSYLKEHFTISIIPMLNPDGASLFTRRNAATIDMNRDAVAFASVEMQLFYMHYNSFKPHWAFNLHDQRNFFSVGHRKKTATISFLAPSADIDRKLTAVRQQSMQLIASLYQYIEQHLPGHTAKYTDEFYPTALGEFFHIKQTPCVLIESGAFVGDMYRDEARKWNFLLILKALEDIASKAYVKQEIETYIAIPENGKAIKDVVIRDCSICFNERMIKADMGLMYKEEADFESGLLQRRLYIEDIGDLQHYAGLEELKGGVITEASNIKLDALAHNIEIQQNNGTTIQLKNGQIKHL